MQRHNKKMPTTQLSQLWERVKASQWTRRLAKALLVVIVAFTLLWALPNFVPSSDAMTHLTAKLQSRLVGGFYPSQARDDITVALIDAPSLSSQGWPVPYATHARWLKTLALYAPRAIFVDITFAQARNDNTLPTMVDALCALRDQGIPVFLAALEDKGTGELRVRQGLKNRDGERPCFTLVNVVYETHKVDRLVWTYPLWTQLERENPQRQAPTPLVRSAALAIAQDVAGITVRNDDKPMALTWGVNNLDQQRFAPWCRQARGGFREIAPPFLRVVWSGDEIYKVVCPYHRALTMQSMKSPSVEREQELRDLITGRFVMLGADLEGSNDTIASPVHGDIPGVFMHAMALDNLLTYEGHYKRALEWGMLPAWPLFWLGLSIVLIAHTLRESATGIARVLDTRLSKPYKKIWRFIGGRLEPEPPEINRTKSEAAVDPLHIRCLNGLVAVVMLLFRKILSIFVTGAVVMLLVVGSQKVFDIGTLPIVDLVVMALFAEWLGWTDRIWNIFVPKEK